jgi:hypothetical protein
LERKRGERKSEHGAALCIRTKALSSSVLPALPSIVVVATRGAARGAAQRGLNAEKGDASRERAFLARQLKASNG